ncbi:hypothetical protein GIB67_005407, partial [Kingdonia uniflora]
MMWNESSCSQPEQADADVDELLAVLGYKVRSSDMAEVAQKLEQLEMVMANAQAQQDGIMDKIGGALHIGGNKDEKKPQQH